MKQKLLFLALMAIGSQTSPRWHHYGGYWGGAPVVYGPGYGYYGPAYYGPGYYRPSAFDSFAGLAGDIALATAISNNNKSDENYSRKRARDEDPNKSRRAQLAGDIFDAEQELEYLEKSNANSADIAAKKDEIKRLKAKQHSLK